MCKLLQGVSGVEKRESLISVAAVIILLLVLIFSIYFILGFFRSVDALQGNLLRSAEDIYVELKTEVFEKKDTYTFLVYGVGTEDALGEGTILEGTDRSDMIALVKVFPEEEKAHVLSVPRDTYAEIPGREGKDRIAHAHSHGGSELLQEALENFTGVSIDYYFGMNFFAFRDIVNFLQGVEMDVPSGLVNYSPHIHEEGTQILDGDMAYDYTTYYPEHPGPDIPRVERHQALIRKIEDKAKEKAPDSYFYIMMAIQHYVDTDISGIDAVGMALHFSGIEEDDVVMEVVPGEPYEPADIRYLDPDMEETERIIEELFS